MLNPEDWRNLLAIGIIVIFIFIGTGTLMILKRRLQWLT